jgi:hypothetical protein
VLRQELGASYEIIEEGLDGRTTVWDDPISEHFRRVAEEYGCQFFDTSGVIVSSDIDGIHLESSEHRKLGEAVADRVREILG